MIVRLAFGAEGALRAALKGHILVVVDTLRASTTVTTILENGGVGVVPALTIEEAVGKARELLRTRGVGVLLAGERRGLKIPGFDFGNSPLEFTRDVVEGKIVVLTTTNFTQAVCQAVGAPAVFAGCLRNASAVAEAAGSEATKTGRKLTVVHVGRRGEFSPEDYVTACVIKCFVEGREPPDYKECVLNSPSAKELASIGLWRDVEYCSQLNASSVVPVIKGGMFVEY
ncbi:MAG: 2-phosphosulfolactate phosphatase [Candidatus Jordarchaeales archaeon]